MKKNNIGSIFYVVICLLLCVIPFAGMPVASTDTTTENKKLAEFPEIKENGKWNTAYLQEMGDYFEDHFAFRPLLVTADSEIQSKLFKTSNMDTVIVGENGWLYYTATLDDYLGQNTMSERGIYNVAHNLSLMQQYVQDKGMNFLFTVAPNKNSLYGENMPYYDKKMVSDVKNMILLEPELELTGIAYADLFTPFETEKEILYLKRDSHWNQKGAVLAYNTLLDKMEYDHETYETVKNIRTKTEYGDLNKMLYPLSAVPEWNYQYQKEDTYTYVTDTKSVEDAWIQTSNPDGNGNLLMFRDSFGNTLLPLMANVFENGYFSKSTPYNLETYLNDYHPEYVIVEKVERNVDDFATNPPIMTGPIVTLEDEVTNAETNTSLNLIESEYDTSYWEISGVLDEKYVSTNTKVYINVTTNDETTTYEAFTISTENSDNGYLLYIPKEMLSSNSVQIEVLTENDNQLQNVEARSFDVSQIEIRNEN